MIPPAAPLPSVPVDPTAAGAPAGASSTPIHTDGVPAFPVLTIGHVVEQCATCPNTYPASHLFPVHGVGKCCDPCIGRMAEGIDG